MSDDGTQRPAGEVESERGMPLRWFLYPAYGSTAIGGALAVRFAVSSGEWAVEPVALGWGLLLGWFWLYSLAYRSRRPLLRYVALSAGIGFATVLSAFCFDRAVPQWAGSVEDVAFRTTAVSVAWAGVLTGLGALAVLLHALIFGAFHRRHSG